MDLAAIYGALLLTVFRGIFAAAMMGLTLLVCVGVVVHWAEAD